jgi:hypothetical protein
MMRLRSRSSGPAPDEPSPFDEVFRRQEQAHQLQDSAVEPHDFQAVGVQLRECLLSLIEAMRRRTPLGPEDDKPPLGNFIRWYEILMDQLCPGQSNKELRQYLKQTARQTWQLVGWLVHDRDANKTAGSIAFHACGTVVGHSVQLLERHHTDFKETCPTCRSRDVRTHFDPLIGDSGEYYLTCGACRWTSHRDDEDDGDAYVGE